MKIAVITANIENFDTVKEIPKQDIEYDRFYYTDENLPVPMHTQDPRMRAKLMKIMPHWFLPGYDAYVWVDANVQVKSKSLISELVQGLIDGYDFSISTHPFREDIHEEAAFICDQIATGSKYLKSRYSIKSIQAEIKDIGMQSDFARTQGLYWNGLFARANKNKVNQMCERWFMDNVLYTNFDQISFVKFVHIFNLKLHTIEFGDFYSNQYYDLTKHLK